MADFPAKVAINYEEHGSRVELIVRIIYGFILAIIAGIWGIFVCIAVIVQWFHILFTGRKNKDLWEFTASYFRFYMRFFAYCHILTDQRPPISGE